MKKCVLFAPLYIVTTLHKGDNKDDDDNAADDDNKVTHCSKTDEAMSHIAGHEL